MQTKVKYCIVFNRKNNLNNDGSGILEIRAYLNSKVKYFSTGIYVSPTQWNDRTKLINDKHHNYILLNSQIRNKITDLENFELLHFVKHKSFKLCDFELLNKPPEMVLVDFMKKELDKSKQLAKETKISQYNTIRLLRLYNDKITIDRVNFDFINGFENFLFTQNLATNSRWGHHKNVKRWLNFAIKLHLINSNPYIDFKAKYQQTERMYLLPDELKRFENLFFDENSKHLEKIRDMFLFSCYTAYRISDVITITRKLVLQQEQGLFLKLQAKKTGNILDVPLYLLFRDDQPQSKPERIILKYLDDTDKPIFQFTDQYVNRTLKEVAALAGIDKNITFHSARHTFGVIGSTKMSLPMLKEIMQHKKIETTMIYQHISNSLMISELERVKW